MRVRILKIPAGRYSKQMSVHSGASQSPMNRLQAGIMSIRLCIRAHHKASKTSAGRRSRHMNVDLPKWGYEVGLTPKRLQAGVSDD